MNTKNDKRSTRRRGGAMLPGLLLLFPLLFFLQNLGVEGQEAEAENENWSSLSEEKQLNWLGSNTGSSLFFQRLTETIEGTEDPKGSIDLLKRFLPVIHDTEERYRLLLRLASIEESLGDLESAQMHYQTAASLKKGKWDYETLFSSALLLIELGDYSLAELQLNRISENSSSSSLRHKVEVHRARVLVFQEEKDQAEELIDSLSLEALSDPATHYLVYSLALHLEMKKKAGEVKEKLIKEYPHSPEAGMVQGLVERAPSVENVFGLLSASRRSPSPDSVSEGAPGSERQEKSSAGETPAEKSEKPETRESENPVGIQTGSFRDAENAEYMVKELKKYGFSPEIQSAELGDTEYHRVVVPIPEKGRAQDTIIRLKEHGYEGYPIY